MKGLYFKIIPLNKAPMDRASKLPISATNALSKTDRPFPDDYLPAVPEEAVWLANFVSARTRRTYQAVSYTHLDVYKRQRLRREPLWQRATRLVRDYEASPLLEMDV